MLSERERRTLARMEQELRESDPDFVSQFHALPTRPITPSGPSLLLVVGLLLMVLGSAIVAVPLALLGMAVALGALVLAYQRNGRAGFSPA